MKKAKKTSKPSKKELYRKMVQAIEAYVYSARSPEARRDLAWGVEEIGGDFVSLFNDEVFEKANKGKDVEREECSECHRMRPTDGMAFGRTKSVCADCLERRHD